MHFDLIITRHKALVDYLRQSYGIEAEVLEHVEDPKVLDEKHVIGVLPLHLASRCASVTEIPLALTAEDRGRELGLARLREIAGKPATYSIARARSRVDVKCSSCGSIISTDGLDGFGCEAGGCQY